MRGSGPTPIFDAIIERVIAGDSTARTMVLPDEEAQPRRCAPWVAGVWDAVLRDRVRPRQVGRRGDVIMAILEACDDASGVHDHAVTRSLVGLEVVLYTDSIVSVLRAAEVDPEKLSALAARLMTNALDRATVKVALVLAGVAGIDGVVYTVRTLGTHDEFAHYASLAVDYGLASPDSELWRLATRNSPWSSAYAVSRLSRDMQKDLEGWLRRNSAPGALP